MRKIYVSVPSAVEIDIEIRNRYFGDLQRQEEIYRIVRQLCQCKEYFSRWVNVALCIDSVYYIYTNVAADIFSELIKAQEFIINESFYICIYLQSRILFFAILFY